MNILFLYTKINLYPSRIKAHQSDESEEPSNNTFHTNNRTTCSTLKKLYCPKPILPKFCCPDPQKPTVCCPPLKILHNFTSGTCWIISLLHNIRANTKLHKFILQNSQNDSIFSELEEIINLENREITIEEWELMKTFHSIPIAWGDGGNSIKLLEGIFSYIKFKKNDDFDSFHLKYANEYGNVRTNRNIYRPYKYYDTSYYTIYTEMFPVKGYINVNNALRGRPNDSQLSDTNIKDTFCFDKADDFIVLTTKPCKRNNVVHKEVGMTIQKEIYVNVKNENQQQKYSLTGILLNEKTNEGFGHAKAFIKCNYRWYDTDYEMIKTIKNIFKQELIYDFFLDLENQFRTEISVDYSGYREFNVRAVFYQKVV